MKPVYSFRQHRGQEGAACVVEGEGEAEQS